MTDFNLDEFNRDLINRKQYLEQHLPRYLSAVGGTPPIIREAMEYAVMNGGKRIRPIMALEGYRIAGGQSEKALPTACALEFIHCYSLVHDDLPAMDDDDFRRGKPTCHRVYGEANAILTGDALLTAAFELMASNADIEGIEMAAVVKIIREVAQAIGSRGMIGGQVMDLAGEDCAEFDLRTLHGLKTGELFKASLRAGAILGGMSETDLAALTRFGHFFGLAFQITDDILDICGDQSQMGKPIGSDEKNIRTTYTSLYGLDGARRQAEQSVNECLQALTGFGLEANFLRDLAKFTLHRTS